MPRKSLVLKLRPKMLLASEISVYFNDQYFINGLISDFVVWNVDMHEWKEQSVLMGFLKKIFFGQMGPLRPENGASSKLWICTMDFFLKLCTVKGLKRYMNIKNIPGQWDFGIL